MDNVKKLAEKQGLKIEVVEFNDYVTPNVALFQGEVFANSMQHRPYLDATLQKEPKFDLVEVFKTVNFPMAAYSKTLKKGDAIPDGATIGIPNDPSNGGRAILVLANAGADQSQRYQKTLLPPLPISPKIHITSNSWNWMQLPFPAACPTLPLL